MKQYRVTVNGRAYDVVVEDLGGTSAPAVASMSRAAASAPAPRPVMARPAAAEPVVVNAGPAPVASAGAGTMASPLPGVIMRVVAQKEKRFARGDILLTIEAMKMENEILAPYDCKVEDVYVTPTQPVQTGTPLLKIEKL
jgi:biotin carboxyl carrier protein